jgi:hypothetical protein
VGDDAVNTVGDREVYSVGEAVGENTGGGGQVAGCGSGSRSSSECHVAQRSAAQ